MREGRVLSRSRPSTPSCMKRSCQRQTQVLLTCPCRRMISAVPQPSAVRRTIRARQTCFCGLFRSATTASRRTRSAGLTFKVMPVRIPQTRTAQRVPESQKGLFRQVRSTSSRPSRLARMQTHAAGELLAAHNTIEQASGFRHCGGLTGWRPVRNVGQTISLPSGGLSTAGRARTWQWLTSGTRSLTQLVGLWGSERAYFMNGDFPAISTTGNWMKVGHYSQMVWRATTEVGCGFAEAMGATSWSAITIRREMSWVNVPSS